MSLRTALLLSAGLGLLAGPGLPLGSAPAPAKVRVPAPAPRMHPEAPPTIPHPLDPATACGDCHGPERSGGVPGIPHRAGGFCQSCHVPQQKVAPYRPNTFRSERRPLRGARAQAGAPPQLPHPVFMRENCLACHGGEPHPGMRRNPHPKRPNCQSCHLPRANR